MQTGGREQERKGRGKKLNIKENSHPKVASSTKKYEAFQKFQDSMNSLSLSPTGESMFVNIFNLSSNTIKDAFTHIRGKLGKLPNQRRKTLSRDIIFSCCQELSRYLHHHHHITPLLYHCVTPLLPMDHHLHRVIPLF